MYGLKSSEVEKQREKYGSNKLPEKKLKTGFQFFMETFESHINQILLAMMIVFTVIAVFGQGSYSEPIGVAVVLLAIALLGMNTGLKSQKSAKELKDRTSIHYCNVIRDGKVEHINSNDLVVGDLVIIQSGEAIYADGYLVEGNVKVDNSVLNGESEPCKKTAWDKEDSPITFGGQRKADSSDYTNSYALFSGTTVTDGEGKMIVTNVGVDTVNGQTISTIDEIEETKTSLEIQLEDLAGQISKFGYIGASIIVVALIITNIIQYGGIAEYFGMGWIGILKNILTIAVTALTIIVAAVPEGLPLIINLITAQNAKVMIKHNVLAKHTNKIPEAGNIQLLCTDKTGTLTVGKLVPVENVMGDGKSIIEDENTYNLFKYNVILNSSAMFDENNKIVGGNATERALLSLVNADEYKKITNSATIVSKKSFNSANKFSAVETEYNGETFTYYKGAPERLIDAAEKCVTLNGLEYIDKDKLKMIVRSYTVKAMRVIATGYSSSKLPEDGLPNDLTLVDDDNVVHRIGDCCVFIMDDNYKSNIIGCIADIGFCNNCISVEEVNSSGQLTLLFTEHIKVIGRLED